jgi:CRP/FNR family transcriptional regulator, cyclic AMP receptor protein
LLATAIDEQDMYEGGGVLPQVVADLTQAARQPRCRTLVRILESDPDLTRGLEPELAYRVRRQLVTEVIEVPTGPWDPPPELERGNPLGLLVLDGLLSCSVVIEGRRGVELHGDGDLIRPWSGDATASVAFEPTWRALAPSWLAILDREFEALAARCPGLLAELMDRVVRRRSLAVTRALAQIPLLESRLLVFLWQLADRWGRVEPDGVVIDLALNQATLGDLVGACRQSVSRALGALTRRGVLARRDGRWVLCGSPPSASALLQVEGALPEPVLAVSA